MLKITRLWTPWEPQATQTHQKSIFTRKVSSKIYPETYSGTDLGTFSRTYSGTLCGALHRTFCGT